MDLIPLLTRAESIFRRFERIVHRIDKNNNLPTPPTLQRRHTQANENENENQNGKGKGKSTQHQHQIHNEEEESTASSSAVYTGAGASTSALQTTSNNEKVVSPILRQLLCKNLYWVEEKS